MYRGGARVLNDCDSTSMKHPSRLPVFEIAMALFGMVWLLRVRSEMRRCSKCRREELLAAQQQQQQQQQQQEQQQQPISQAASLLQTPDDAVTSSANTLFTLDTPGAVGPAGSYCEVHGYVPSKEDIQEFYELTLLDDTKTVQQKTAETIRIADKWEASDGPITPTFAQNDKTRFSGGGVEEQLPPPPSPPQLKEASQLDGIPRLNSVDRILQPDGTQQHILASHEALNKSHDSWQGHDSDQNRMEFEDY